MFTDPFECLSGTLRDQRRLSESGDSSISFGRVSGRTVSRIECLPKTDVSRVISCLQSDQVYTDVSFLEFAISRAVSSVEARVRDDSSISFECLSDVYRVEDRTASQIALSPLAFNALYKRSEGSAYFPGNDNFSVASRP